MIGLVKDSANKTHRSAFEARRRPSSIHNLFIVGFSNMTQIMLSCSILFSHSGCNMLACTGHSFLVYIYFVEKHTSKTVCLLSSSSQSDSSVCQMDYWVAPQARLLLSCKWHLCLSEYEFFMKEILMGLTWTLSPLEFVTLMWPSSLLCRYQQHMVPPNWYRYILCAVYVPGYNTTLW